MKSREEIMNMLEAFDLTGSLRGAGELAGVSHHTVARYVAERDAGELAGDGPRRRERIIDPFFGEDRGVGRAVARQDPRRPGLRQAHCFGLHRFRTHGAPGGGGGEGQPSPWSAAGVSAVDPRAWDVGAVGLGRGSGHRGPKDESVLCVVGVVEVPGGGAVLGSQVGDGDRLCGSGDASYPARPAGRSVPPRCSAASQTATWPRSWLLTRPDNAGAPTTCTRCSPAPPPGAASAPTDEPSTDRRGRRPVAPCACPTCAPQRRSCWPPPRHNAGNRPKRCAHCSPRSSPAAKHRLSGPGARRPGSPPARPSTPGTRQCHRSRRRPSGRCAPWSGSTATRISSCADHQAHPRPISLKRSAKPPSMPATKSPGSVSPGSVSSTSARSCAATAPTTPPPKRSGGSCAPTSS